MEKRYAFDEHSTIVVAIERMADSIERINERHDRFSERIELKVDNMQENINKFSVLFEKLVHIEKVHEDNNKRVHHRIDDIVKRIDKIESFQNDSGCATLREFKKEILPTIEANTKAINSIEEKPKKRMETVVTEVIKALVIFIVGAVSFKIGMKP